MLNPNLQMEDALGDPPIPGLAPTQPPPVDPATGAPIVPPPAPTPLPAAPLPTQPMPVDPALLATISNPLPARGKKGSSSPLPTPEQIRAAGNATSGAAEALGTAKSEGAQGIASAEDEAAATEARAAEETRKLQQRQSEALDVARRDTQAAFQQAKEMKIPDFWEGRPGKQVMAAIAVGLGGGASVLAHQSGNSTYEIIKDQIDSYSKEQKRQIDSAFRVAEEKGKLTDQMRLDYAQELATLQIEHAALTHSAAAKVRSLTAQSKGRVDEAEADLTARKLDQDTLSNISENEKNRAQIGLIKSEQAKNYAQAAYTKDVRGREKQAAADAKTLAGVEREFNGTTLKAMLGTGQKPGPLKTFQDARQVGDGIREAAATGDPQALLAAIIAGQEKISKMNTGGVLTKEQLALINTLKGDPASVKERIGRFFGDPQTSKQFADGVLKLVDQSEEHALRTLDDFRQGAVTKALGNEKAGVKPLFKTQAEKDAYISKLAELTSAVTTRTPNGTVPRYAEGGKPTESDNDTITIQNQKGEKKTVTRAEARKLGAIR